MILDPTSPGLSLQAAQGLVETLRSAIVCASCPQWTGVGGDSYRARCGEVVAGAQAVVDQIQQALDLVPAFDTERAHGLARSLSESAESAVLHPELVMLGAW